MSRAAKRIQGDYNGEGPSLFMLSMITGLLTILTLGIYRFWAKSRIRRYIWSATAPNGDAMEYTGTGTEKLIGFLIALVFLAVYLGIIQVLLSFGGFAVWDTLGLDPESTQAQIAQGVGGLVSFAALTPLILFAQYRGRRYMMSRTRWRGLRFGMDQGAVGYALRGVLYGALSVVSLGLLIPLMTFKLEKYMTDRTWYGDAQFEQEGSWTELYRSAIHVILPILAFVAIGALVAVTGDNGYGLLSIIAGIWLLVGIIYYRVDSFRRMARNKIVDDVMTFEADAATGNVVTTLIKGGIASFVLLVVASLPIVIITMGLEFDAVMNDPSSFELTPVWFAGIIMIVVMYFVLLLLSNAFRLVFISQPILAHFVETTTLLNGTHLDEVAQRANDQMPDAEGFADALDIGGAF
ncbi:DUF898 family protein [Algirhabdus cladophorae]|uniref:DUF898 family protein n=1 Tax=Algirhabdus cladophorae TaxID=3377108 RepID=UPI003B8462CA